MFLAPFLFTSLLSSLLIARPKWLLILAFYVSYNPIYSLFVLNQMGYELSWIRMSLTAIVLFFLSLSILIANTLNSHLELNTKVLNKEINAIIYILLFSFLVGVLSLNKFSEIIVSFYPFIEAIAFFLLTFMVLNNKKDIDQFIQNVLFWIVLNFSFALLFYFYFGQTYLATTSFFGITIPRLNDIQVGLLLPFLFCLLFSQEIRRRYLIYLCFFLGVLILLLGFFRTTWLSVFLSIFLIFLIKPRLSLGFGKKITSFFYPASVLVLIGFVSTIDIFGNESLFSTVSERLLSNDSSNYGSSVYGRLEAMEVLFVEGVQFPELVFGHGLGSYFSNDALPTSSSSNYFLSLLHQLGLFQFTFLIFILIYLVKELFLILRAARTNFTKLLCSGLIGCLFSLFIILNLFPSVLHFPLITFVASLYAIVLRLFRLEKNVIN